MDTLKNHFLVIISTLIVAGSFISAAELSSVMKPISLTLLRFVIAALALLPIILYKAEYRRQVIKVIPRSIVISLFYSAFFICMFTALHSTTALNTSAIYTLVPFLTALISLLIFREKLTGKMLAVYLFGTLGTAWVIFDGDINALLTFSLNQGDALFFAGCISMVFFSLSMKHLYKRDAMIVMVFCTLLGGAFWMLLAIFAFEQTYVDSLLSTTKTLRQRN